MKSVSQDDDLLLRFRKGAFDELSGEEKSSLWQRIDKTTGKKVLITRICSWAAAACIILLLGAGYLWNRHTAPESGPAMLTVRTQAQQRIQVVLPDSSVVWLNARSRLEYPEKFDDNRRMVLLNGEAYFEVTADSLHPFIVRTPLMDVQVLGTVFNITSYKDETVTTLLEGSVAVTTDSSSARQSAMLVPNQQVTFRKDDPVLRIQTVDPVLYTSWIEGYYKFEKTTFNEIAGRLENIYGVNIFFENDQLKELSYTGTFVQDQSLPAILELLKEINEFNYQIEKNNVYINK